MSYAIAPTFEGNFMGIRRMGTLKGAGHMLSGLGDALADQYAALLVAGGVDPSLVSMLQLNGASSDQLAAVYDGSIDATSLLNQLTGAQGPSNPSSPQNPIPTTISTAFGLYDLSQQSAWNAINSLFTSTQQNLTVLARQFPNDADVISHVSDFNSKVTQWAGYYQQAFGSSPSPMPVVTLSGLGFAPIIVGAAVVAGVATLVYFLYTVNQWIASRNASTAVTAQQTQNQTALLSQYQAAIASGNNSVASQLLTAIKSTGPADTTSTAWLSSNWPWLVAGGFAFLLFGIIVEKRV
jgi:hypothetical protein